MSLTASTWNTDKNRMLAATSAARVGAELGNIATGWLTQFGLPSLMPDFMKDVKQWTANSVIYAGQPVFERFSGWIPGLQSEQSQERYKTLSEDQKRLELASGVVDLSMNTWGGIIGQTAAQIGLDHTLGVPQLSTGTQLRLAMMDRSVQLGSMVVLGTVGKGFKDRAEEWLSGILQKHFHRSPEAANEMAAQAVSWNIPNAIGALALIGRHQHHNLKALQAPAGLLK